ncbi:MAG: S8 family serine peptidase [Planctomycetes bacterium]|nr:S8 family serine peptidase [Planctomycetota bacterium]
MHSPRSARRSLLFATTLLLAACGGGGGGSSPPVQPRSSVAGQIRVPAAPLRLPQEAEVRREMLRGEVVVWLDAGATPPDLTARGLDLVQPQHGPVALYRLRTAQYLPTLAEGAELTRSAEFATCETAIALEAVPGITCASPNLTYRPCRQPNDEHFGKQWHYPQINLPQAWDITQGSANVIVAVIDTGIVSAHPDLQGRIIAGFDMISDPANAADGDGRDANPEDVGDGSGGQPSSFHGTHVAGTIGANSDNNIGVAGIDWNCRLMPIRALGRQGGSTADIADAILFAARLPNGSASLPAARATIVNMSLGAPGSNPVMQQACDQAAAAGVLLIAAAGNDNTGNPGSPAQFSSVISVGAVDLARERAPYSNFHTSIDIWAPGGDMTQDRNGDTFADGVLSTMADDRGLHFFAFEQGTSMAAPHVAGVAALIKAALPTADAARIRQILLSRTQAGSNLPNGGRMLDALAAVQEAAGGNPGVEPLLVITPSAIDFGATRTTDRVTLENRGGGSLVFDDAFEDPPAPWLQGTLIPSASGTIDVGAIDLVVDRTGLPAGTFQTRITVQFLNGANLVFSTFDVRLQVGAPPISNDTVFVLLVDAATFENKSQSEATAATSFRYSNTGVPPGTYLLFAGTDRDDDGFLGDEGELFGAWPNLDTRLQLGIDGGQNLTGLDFSLRELVVISSTRPAGLPGPLRRLR